MKQSSKRTLTLAIIIIALAVLAGVGFFAYTNSKKRNDNRYATFNYQNYRSYKLIDGKMSFEIPSELQKITETKDQVEFIQYWTLNNAPGLTYVAAMAQPNSIAMDDSSLVALNKVLSDTKNPAYNSATSSLKKFITDRLGRGGWKVEVQPAHKFTNPSIFKDAWSFEVTSTYADNRTEGRAIYAISSSNYYFFLISSNRHNWQNQAGAWEKSFDSLKVE